MGCHVFFSVNVRLAAIQALYNSLSFIRTNFENKVRLIPVIRTNTLNYSID